MVYAAMTVLHVDNNVLVMDSVQEDVLIVLMVVVVVKRRLLLNTILLQLIHSEHVAPIPHVPLVIVYLVDVFLPIIDVVLMLIVLQDSIAFKEHVLITIHLRVAIASHQPISQHVEVLEEHVSILSVRYREEHMENNALLMMIVLDLYYAILRVVVQLPYRVIDFCILKIAHLKEKASYGANQTL